MQFGHLLTEWVRHRATSLRCGQALPAFAGGSLVGLLIVSTALPWLLTWGQQREFLSAACLMCGVGLLAGRSIRFGRGLHWSQLAGAACVWAMLQPVVFLGLTSSLHFLPVTMLESVAARSLIALLFAVPVWFVAAVGWVRVAEAGRDRSFARGSSRHETSFAICLGLACGLATNAFLLSILCGTWLAAVVGLVATLAGWWRSRSAILNDRVAAERLAATPSACATNNAGLPSAPTPLALGPNVGNQNSWTTGETIDHPSRFAPAVAALALGGLFATDTRLLGQLMPSGFQVGCAEWIGLVLGCGCVALLARRESRHSISTHWVWLFAAAWSALMLAAFPTLVDSALWMNASLTWVTTLLTARSALLIVTIVPLGIALASATERRGEDLISTATSCGLPFACGLVLASFSFPITGFVWPMGLCCGSLVALALIERVRARVELSFTWPAALGMTSLALAGLSVPLWQSHDDPARVAKLLFSTPAFLAHRSGWESRLLPLLDDTRLVFRTEGPRGPLTLWRSRGLELHLRENGVPRAVVSVNTDVHPQFAPEVLQAALPLVMSDRPSRVLLLGASGGVPLATCLHFPVREAVCVEADASLIDMLRGPIAKETGFDPLSDDRVRLIAAPPELALMAASMEDGHSCPSNLKTESRTGKSAHPTSWAAGETFDIILSSPPSSAVVAGGASFTTEYYRRASRRLADRGIFCQRFECLDYGPDPLRLVVQSLRQAFREVIAVETAAGELLLMATNSEGVFIPDDLPARLEAPHVRKLLARSGLDWSSPLNFPTYDHAALGEICEEAHTWSNSSANGLLAVQAPLDMMRWGAKLQETQRVLTAVRTTPAPFWNREGGEKSNLLANEVQLSRKSRFLEWLGDSRVSAELLRRLSEVVTQQKLVREHPESHWWEYRKALRQQLQDHPRSSIQQVKHVRGEKQAHPEDITRKNYFEAFGEAAQRAKPTVEQIAAMEACLEPYDPLLSYFGRQEVADLQARSDRDPAGELAHRLHVIYFAPVGEASTRNVASAMELLVRHPEAIPDDMRRFDVLNGLVQLLRTRWESRQNTPVLTVARQLTDVDRSVVAVEKCLTAMDGLAPSTNLTPDDWTTRKQVVDRILLRPLRSYRASLQATVQKNEGRTRAILEQAAEAKAE